MSTFSNVEFGNMVPAPVKTLEYRDMGGAMNSNGASSPSLDDLNALEDT